VADVVDSANVGVIEGRGGLCFALEARDDLRVAGYIVGKKFERDQAMKTSVFGFINHAHASATELLDDAVVGDGLSDERGGVGHCGAILAGARRRPKRAFAALSARCRLEPG